MSVQEYYDAGNSWRGVMTKFHISHATMARARKLGNLKCRTKSDAAKLSWSAGRQNPEIYRTENHRKIMSKFGGLKPRSGRCKKILYTKKDGSKVWLQGTWEVKFATFLDSNKVDWEKNKLGYKYVFEGKEHHYFPDFWLPDFKIYVEVKGYETEKDRAKWNQFPFKLVVAKKQEIQDLTTWWRNIKL